MSGRDGESGGRCLHRREGGHGDLGNVERRSRQVCLTDSPVRERSGQLALLAAVAPYYSCGDILEAADVLHFIDHTTALSGLAKGYSPQGDSPVLIRAFHALNIARAANEQRLVRVGRL